MQPLRAVRTQPAAAYSHLIAACRSLSYSAPTEVCFGPILAGYNVASDVLNELRSILAKRSLCLPTSSSISPSGERHLRVFALLPTNGSRRPANGIQRPYRVRRAKQPASPPSPTASEWRETSSTETRTLRRSVHRRPKGCQAQEILPFPLHYAPLARLPLCR